jgi:hypothetical protein
MTGGALAIGASYVNGPEFPFWIMKIISKFYGI